MALFIRCQVCSRLTKGGRIPKGGDGSFRFPRVHRGQDGEPCPGSFQEGVFEEGEDTTPQTPPILIPRACQSCHIETNGTRRIKCSVCSRLVCKTCVVSEWNTPVICARCKGKGVNVPIPKPDMSVSLPPAVTLDPVTAYAQSVLSGQTIANKLVKLACQRHLDDLTRPDLYFDRERVRQHIDFFRIFLRLSSGKHEGKPFVLLTEQEFIQGSIFGWYHKDPSEAWTDSRGHLHYKRRRFEVVYIEGAKGWGKSPLAAGTGIFCASFDGVPRAECFFFASKKEQADVSFSFLVAMVDQSPYLSKRYLKVGQVAVDKIIDPKTNSYIKPVSRDNKKSGPTVHFAGGDELHEHPDDVVLSMMRQNMKGENPLLYLTTNSGTDKTSVCYQQREQACKMLDGTIPNDSLFAFICGLDDEELKVMGLMKPDRDDPPITQQDPIDYLLAHEEIWVKANPSLGKVRSFDYVRKRLLEAKGLPAQRNRVLRLNFCVWTDSQTVWIPDGLWMGCAEPSLSVRHLHPKFGRMTRLESELVGKRCYMGMDMARGAGFHAIVLIFPDDEGELSRAALEMRLRNGVWEPEKGPDGENIPPSVSDPNNQLYSLLEFYFMDREAFDRRAQDMSILHAWREDGELEVWPEVLALGSLLDFITDTLMVRYGIEACAYDPAFVSPQMALNLEQAGLKMVTWEQQYRLMHAPIAEAERRARVGLWRHRGHPITRWMMGNVRLETDRGGRSIISKAREVQNVDGPSALATGLGWCMRANEGVKVTSAYETRGIRVFEGRL